MPRDDIRAGRCAGSWPLQAASSTAVGRDASMARISCAGRAALNKMALHLGATQGLDGFALPDGLDPFRGRDHAAVGGDTHDGPDDGSLAGIAGHFLDEAAVDLDLV